MQRLATAVICLLALNACIVIPGQGRYVPLEQAALKNNTKSLREVLDRLEPLIASHGYRIEGVPVERTDVLGSHLWYDGPADSVAVVDVEDGCISFSTFVKEGAQDFRAPRSLFEDVLDQLALDGTWLIQRGEVCPT